MKILVIEDDYDVRTALKLTLEDEGLIVDTVDNGAEGLYRAAEWKYDVIILDVMLPEMNGWQVLEALRKKKNLTPVLMLTALDAMDDRVKGLEIGADDYLTKPYDERELFARIRALHRRSVGQPTGIIDLGDVEINTTQSTIMQKGEPVDVTAAQYRIIEYLGARAGQVLTKNELAEAIIGGDEEAWSNVLEVHIYNIRRKLGKHFIQNRRGLGYLIPKP